jgi:hypothetical protein
MRSERAVAALPTVMPTRNFVAHLSVVKVGTDTTAGDGADSEPPPPQSSSKNQNRKGLEDHLPLILTT